jgi:hypothetical protein
VIVEMGKMAQRLTLFTAVSFALPEVKGNEAAAYQVLHEMRSVEHESSQTPWDRTEFVLHQTVSLAAIFA